jgi:hypothetical protein
MKSDINRAAGLFDVIKFVFDMINYCCRGEVMFSLLFCRCKWNNIEINKDKFIFNSAILLRIILSM